MRVTGPTLRRRNHAWLQMRSLDRRAARLARRRQQEDDAADEADTSSDESEGLAGDDSDSDSDTEPTTASRPPLVSATVRAGNRGSATLLPTPLAGVSSGVALGASEPAPGVPSTVGSVESESEPDGVESDSEDSADESTAPPRSTTRPTGYQLSSPLPTVTSSLGYPNFAAPPPPPATVTSKTESSTSRAPRTTSWQPDLWPTALPNLSTSRSSRLDELVTSITGLPSKEVASATSGPSPTLPATGGAQTEEEQAVPPGNQANEQEGEGLSIGRAQNNGLSSSAVAGIVLGVLTFVGLLIGAVLLWRKWRRDRDLPFMPQKGYRLDEDEPRGPSNFAAGGVIGNKSTAPVKTNTQIMDELMRAAYAADKGANDLEGAFAPPAVSKVLPRLPPRQQQLPQPPQPTQPQPPQRQPATAAPFMDEKAYTALAGPPTPGSPKKPVMRWLDEVKTPTQPSGPGIPPTPQMPPSPEMARLPAGRRRVPEPPRPLFRGRDTMTTDTTNTSVRRYG